MKKMIYIATVLMVLGLMNNTNAQVSVNINIGNQPAWGPTGYNYVQYYYLPALNMYYDIHNRNYVYMQGNRWITSHSIPSRYKRINLYSTYKVVLNTPNPWQYNASHQRVYAKYAHVHNQRTLRSSRTKGHVVTRQRDNHDHARKARVKRTVVRR